MKVTSLRLGNIVSLIYDPDTYGVIVAMDMSGNVHLSNKEAPDDVRDVIGTKITEKILSKFGCETVIYVNGIEIIVSFSGKKVSISIDGVLYQMTFLHQLQNVFHAVTGQEFIEPDELLQLAYR